MKAVRYRIVAAADGWRLLSDGERLGRFRDESAALRAALEIAGSSRRQGLEVEVLQENARGEIRVVECGEELRLRTPIGA